MRHSLNMQQAILNKHENGMERVGVRARVRKKERKKTDQLGISLKEKVRTTQPLSDWRAIEGGKKSRQAYRNALTDQHQLKDT